MDIRKGIAPAILLGIFSLTAASARAQFSIAPVGGYVADGEGGGARPRKVNAVLQVFPHAPFQNEFAFQVPDMQGNPLSLKFDSLDNGILVAGEIAFANRGGRGGYALGGWYWSNTTIFARASVPIPMTPEPVTETIYELHGKYYFTRQIGVQLGYVGLSGGRTRGKGYDYFLLYTLSPPPREPNFDTPYAVQIGLGRYLQDVDTRLSPEQSIRWRNSYFSVFITGSVEIAKNVTLDASYWYFRSSDIEFPPGIQSIRRLAFGVGYKL